MRKKNIGRLAVCMHGRIGVVKDYVDGIYYGDLFFYTGNWKSRAPRFLSAKDELRVRNLKSKLVEVLLS